MLSDMMEYQWYQRMFEYNVSDLFIINLKVEEESFLSWQRRVANHF